MSGQSSFIRRGPHHYRVTAHGLERGQSVYLLLRETHARIRLPAGEPLPEGEEWEALIIAAFEKPDRE